MNIELEFLNKLFLELSQIVTAKTARELRYEKALCSIRDAPSDTYGTLTMTMRLTAKEALATVECKDT